jgi:hypothetical protein
LGSKIIKIGLYILLFAFLLLGGCILAIRTNYVQNILLSKVTERLSDELGTEVSIEEIGVAFPNYAVLQNILIRDYNNDSLLFISELRLGLNDYNADKQVIKLSNLELDQLLLYFHKPENGKFNYIEILSKIQGPKSSKQIKPWSILLENLRIKNGSFVFHNAALPEPQDRAFKENNIRLSEINLAASDFHLIGDSMHFELESMSAIENSGLALADLTAEVQIYSKGISFDKLKLHTNHSMINDQFVMTTRNYQSYADFIDSVYMYGDFKESHIDFRDIAYFSNQVTPYVATNFDFEGIFRGTLKSLKLKNTKIKYGENTKIVAKGKIKGLPFWDDTYVDFKFEELSSDYKDLEAIGLAEELPTFLKMAGLVQYKGEFKGFHNDFVTYGSLVSDVGTIYTDLNFKVKSGLPESYSGHIAGADIQLGKLLNIDQLGTTSFRFDLKEGTGLNIHQFQSVIEGSIDELVYNNYSYSNTTVKGKFDRKKFVGDILIDDQNLGIDLKGDVDYSLYSPVFNVSARIQKANLEAIGLDSTIQNVRGVAKAQFSGSGIVDFNGTFSLTDVEILKEGEIIPLSKLEIKSESLDSSQRVVLSSDFIDVRLEGVYDIAEWSSSYEVFLHDLFPDYYPLPVNLPKPASYHMVMKFKNHPFLASISGERFQFGTGTLEAIYTSTQQSLRVDGKLSHVGVDDYRLENWDFNIIKEPNQLLNLSMDIARLKEKENLLTHDIVFDAHILPNDAEFLFNFAYPEDDFALNSFGELKFREDTIEAYFMESVLHLKGEQWAVSEKNKVIYETEGLHIKNLNLQNQASHLKLHGDITGNQSDTLSVQLKNFDLSNVNQFLGGDSLGGVAFGHLDLFRLTGNPFFHGDLLVEDLVYNNNFLGNLKLFSESEKDPLVMDVYALMERGLIKDLEIAGSVNLHENEQSMDLDIHLRDVDASPLEEIFKDLASNFDGTISAEVSMKGKFDKPKIEGVVKLKDMGLTVDYLQTRYVSNGIVKIKESELLMDDIILQDEKGDSGFLAGSIKHRYFTDFNFDLNFKDLNNFLVMNTTKKDNELFYGKAIIDGSMKVKGPLDDIYLDIFAKTRKNTEIYIPLVYEAGSSNVSYINFVDFNDTTKRQKKKQNLDGLTMNLTMDITPDAKTELIFDEFVNDKITGRGEGRIKMEITSSGEFDMYGDYTIEEGEYPISAFNTTPTKFILKKGGRIRWDGDPYEAKIDIEANILESVNPNDLLASSSVDLQNSSDNIEVECQLFLKGSLFSPDISFGLNVPNTGGAQAPTRFNAVLNSIKDDPDELNRQVFAIIVFGSFIPPTFAQNSASPTAGDELINTVRNSVSGMISNQLSHWISRYDKSWSFGVNWDQGSIDDRQQFIVEVKKYLFKERLALEGNYDVNSNNGSNPYDVILSYEVSDKLKFRTFRKLANDPTLGNSNTVTTTGVGIFYRRQFNHFFRRRNKNKKDISKAKP